MNASTDNLPSGPAITAAWRPAVAGPWGVPLWSDAAARPVPQNLARLAELDGLGPWYHDFASLGVAVEQMAGIFSINQRCKETIILGYLAAAMAKSRRSAADRPAVLELFAGDGYYTCHALRMGAGEVHGVDLNPPSVHMANAMAAALFGRRGVFSCEDVYTYSPAAPCDVLINCGGLYHIADPGLLIAGSRQRFGCRYMVVQSVVTLETQDAGYFVTPAPGWKHGSRFTAAFLRKTILDAGWRIIDMHLNELEGNERPCDRGSAYFLCEWA